MILKSVMTVKEAAKRWSMPAPTIYSAISDGRLRAHKSGGIWLITEEDMSAAYGEPRKGGHSDVD